MKRELRIAVYGILILSIAGLTSCSIEKKLQQEEEEQIRNFLALNNITQDPTESGLYYMETLTGTGDTPSELDTVGVYYTMKLLTGVTLEDKTSGDPYEFVLFDSDIIAGFQEGVSLMRVGGKANLLIPSSLAWGSFGYGYYVGPYTPVYFEMELIYIISGPGRK
ncbi:MAG: FKBP-type peptidyl-prolyl cis-trans isomerase [Bacteroidales bacterium]